MIQFRIDKAKDFFFDRKAVLAGADRAARRVLSRFGAFVRQTARQSLKKPGKRALAKAKEQGESLVSKPGQPPYTWTGLLKVVFFLYNPNTQSVVIGPALLNKNDIPGLLEQGGNVRRKGKRARYKPRPFMGPALDKEKPKLTEMWRGAVKV